MRKREKTVAGAQDVAGLGSVRRVIEIAVLDTLGLREHGGAVPGAHRGGRHRGAAARGGAGGGPGVGRGVMPRRTSGGGLPVSCRWWGRPE